MIVERVFVRGIVGEELLIAQALSLLVVRVYLCLRTVQAGDTRLQEWIAESIELRLHRRLRFHLDRFGQ